MRFFIFASLVFVFLACAGCSNSDETPGVGFFPTIKISGVYLVDEDNNKIATNQFHVGDTVTFSVRAEDRDRDMETLIATEYTVDDEGEKRDVLNGPEEIDLPPQSGDMTTFQYIYTITIEGSPGKRMMVFSIRDARGNLSKEDSRGMVSYEVLED